MSHQEKILYGSITNWLLFCDIQLSLKYIHTGQTEMLCSHLGNAYSILSGIFDILLECLIEKKYCMTVLPTGFGKSLPFGISTTNKNNE
jgi:hypothetical protein